jgi:hypothetical protein
VHLHCGRSTSLLVLERKLDIGLGTLVLEDGSPDSRRKPECICTFEASHQRSPNVPYLDLGALKDYARHRRSR